MDNRVVGIIEEIEWEARLIRVIVKDIRRTYKQYNEDIRDLNRDGKEERRRGEKCRVKKKDVRRERKKSKIRRAKKSEREKEAKLWEKSVEWRLFQVSGRECGKWNTKVIDDR